MEWCPKSINPLSTHCQRGAERNNTINAVAYNGPQAAVRVTHTIITISINTNHNHRKLYLSCTLCTNPVLCNIAPNMKEGAKCNIRKGLYNQRFLKRYCAP